MNVEAFLDTNVFLYAASKDPADRQKAQRADGLIRSIRFGASLQLAQEFYANAVKKARLGISSEQAETVIRMILRRPLVITDAALFAEAREGCQRWKIGYWDAAMLVAARRLGATSFYSEDLNPGQVFDTVEVINPFEDLSAG